jgi:hypothetical protein
VVKAILRVALRHGLGSSHEDDGLRTTPAPRDSFDTQLAITQILLRKGWEETSTGKIMRKVRGPFDRTPKLFFVITTPNGKMMVRDQTGKVYPKSIIELSSISTKSDILEAAIKLNNGVVRVVQADEGDESGV